MVIETFIRRITKAAEPLKTEVKRSSNYWAMEVYIHCPNGNMIVGHVDYENNKIDDDDVDFEAITAQCREAESVQESSLLVMVGSTRCPDGSCYPHKNFKNLVIPEEITKISDVGVWSVGDFSDFKKLENVTLPSTLKVIGANCFENCESLQRIALPDGLEIIESGAFYGCKRLSDIAVPHTIKEIGRSSFQRCDALCEKGFDTGLFQMVNGVLIDKKHQSAIMLMNIKQIEVPQGIRSIGDRAAEVCDKLQKVVLPESVKSIESTAFYGCEVLSDIVLPEKLSKLGKDAFEGCKALSSIALPPGIKAIPEGAFSYCKSLKCVTISPNVATIGENAFRECEKLTSVNIPEGVTSIEDGAFSGCSSLTSIVLPEGLKKLGRGSGWNTKGAFSYCSSLTSINIPDGIKDISRVFVGCSALTTLPLCLPEDTTEIPDMAFAGCGIRTLDLSRFTSIGDNAFKRCPNLESVEFPATLTQIGKEAFANCQSLHTVTINNPDIKMGLNAFSKCEQLTTVNLPKGLTWSKIKTRFAGSPWGEKGTGKTAEKKAKAAKLAEMRDTAVMALAQGMFIPYKAKATLEDEILTIEVEGNNGCSLVGKINFLKSKAPEDLDKPRLERMKQLMEQCTKEGTMFVFGDSPITQISFIDRKKVLRIVYVDDFNEVFSYFRDFPSLDYVKLPDSVELGEFTFSGCGAQLAIESLRYAVVDGWFIDKQEKEIINDLIGFDNRFLK